MSDIGSLIQTAKAFFATLADNNNRDWWQAHKAVYDATLKAPALQLLDDLSAPLADLADAPIRSKLFRPHRDVRFSKDKTPYNTHLHMMWQIQSDAPQNPVFFFGIGIDYVTAGVGMMGFEPAVLQNWRKMVDLDTDRITGIVAGVEGAGFTLRDPALKRVPPPFAKDHPAAHLLRMKGVVASKEINSTDAILPAFTAGWPVNALLLSIAEA